MTTAGAERFDLGEEYFAIGIHCAMPGKRCCYPQDE
jgi:hypothetical protein